MRYYLVLLFALFSTSLFSQSLQPDWAYAIEGTGATLDFDMTIDSAENVLVAGEFEGKKDFDPGMDTFFLTSNAALDVFIQKLDTDGNLLWAKSIGASGAFSSTENVTAITTAADGSIYLTGDFSGTLDFDPGPGTFDMTSKGQEDIFILKLSPGGDFVWAKSVGGTTEDQGQRIHISEEGNVHVLGTFEKTVDFDPGVDTFDITSSTNFNTFILKLSANGDFLWAKALTILAYSMATDIDEALYVTGGFVGTVDFDPGMDTLALTSNDQGRVAGGDIFILKLAATGDFEWVHGIGGAGKERGDDIAIDPFGNILLTGQFEGNVDFDPGSGNFDLTASAISNLFVLKLDSVGNFTWAKGLEARVFRSRDGIDQFISLGPEGEVYVIGNYIGTVDLDPGPGIFNLTTTGLTDVFVVKLAQDGSFEWAQGAGGTGTVVPKSIEAGRTGDIYIMGNFDRSIPFDPNSGVNDLNALASSDAFVVKFSESLLSIDPNLLPQLTIYPNPTQGMVNIDLQDLNQVAVKVFSIDGKLVHHQEDIQNPLYQFELTGSPGMYLIEIQAEGEIIHLKLLKNE